MNFDVEWMVDKRKHKRIFSEINRKNNGTRRRKAARNRKPCTLASRLLKAVRSTCKNMKFENWFNLFIIHFLRGTQQTYFFVYIFSHSYISCMENRPVLWFWHSDKMLKTLHLYFIPSTSFTSTFTYRYSKNSLSTSRQYQSAKCILMQSGQTYMLYKYKQ